ncbi:PREDICTED: dystonin [Ceratosolen solmsi marchali]|uniref:Dystonin n=1 Tax=Ceratosolen solmsi marchali TaxID=326594 RepID=A0AAJ7E044_9HYME|nr:PREDICTED: dystonin [Ceratosolen solmsi marchali]
MEFELDGSLKEWAKDKPLSILQLDPADRAVLRIADERDAIQKKTFTKWVNKHLKKTYTCLHVCVVVSNQPCCSPPATRYIGDLFQDLRDGHNLISLLEVLSGEHLPRETSGSMRFHMLDNVRIALRFLQCKNIKLVNIQAEDIVDGNPKLTLGLIWTIILHFQISDIVVGQESHVTAREALLGWARRSTARYPGVRVSDFTSSWRDGLAFSALVHRNRPDLLDWRSARAWKARERLEQVFYVAEREYGVTRLLDPEDVDTPEPDEKSLITYISSLYDVFPEPPTIHPLYDVDAQCRLSEYHDVASNLHLWMREKISMSQDRYFPPTLIEIKKLAADNIKFKNEEIPLRYRDKQRLANTFRDLQKYFDTVGEIDIDQELHINIIEKNWNRLMMLHQERDQTINDEIKRLERLQRLAEKVHREMKLTDNRLEELEQRVEDEGRRLDRIHPLEAKHGADLLEQDIRNTEIQVQNIFTDVHTLTEGKYSQAIELHKRVQKLHQRWVALRSLLHKRLMQPLSLVSFPVEERVVTKHRTTVHETRLVDTNPEFRILHDYIDWCKNKFKQINEAEFGSDLPSVQIELDVHQHEHKAIENFYVNIEKSIQAKSNFHGDELTLYNQHLSQLQKIYAELSIVSNKRMSELETLHDFIQSATGEIVWLNDKEETELTRDWSDNNLNLHSVEQYYESLMSDLEKREIQFSAVQDRGESLVLQHHLASKTIEAYMSAMQSQWAWLLQLTLCLEVHLKHASQSQQFFTEIQQVGQWITKKDELLNTIYSQSEFNLNDGERLLKGMQELREELNNYGDCVHRLVEQAKDIIPMKQRKQPVTRPLQITCICSYKQVNMSVEKNEQCILYDNSGRIKWRIKNSQGIESPVPGVCFSFQPPDKEALDTVEKLRRQYEKSVALWQRKQLRLRQNMIFATIKVVKEWTLQEFLDMGQEQRTAIKKALNEDADKLLAEGDPSDPQLRRLKREMIEVNRLFDDFEKRARAEEESRHAGHIFTEQISLLQEALNDAEKILNVRISTALPRDLDNLEHLVLEHTNNEQQLQQLTSDVEQLQETFRSITFKTPQMKSKLDNIMNKWSHIWDLSNIYIEQLKCMDILLNRLDENTTTISEFEIKLASFDELSAEVKDLQNTLEDLMILQNSIVQQQMLIDQLNDDAHTARRLVEKSRLNHCGPHGDMDRLDLEINKLNARWTNICGQLVDRLRSAETAYSLSQQYQTSYHNEINLIDESYNRVENIPSIQNQAEEFEIKSLLNKVTERATAIESINVMGGRLIREGKIYGQKLRVFKQQLEESCPSLDASVKRPRRDSNILIDSITQDLDTINKRYTGLVGVLQERVRKFVSTYAETSNVQQAIEEQYKKCNEAITTLLKWVNEIEDKLAYQDVVSEDIQELSNQMNNLKQLKIDIEAHGLLISTCNDQIRQLTLTDVGDIFSNDEISTLEINGRSLKTRFDKISDRTDKLLKRLLGARDELTKFKNETTTFFTWLDKSQKILVDKERSLSDLNNLMNNIDINRDFVSDIIAHQADLRFITMAAQKFVDESKEYLHILNDFRTSIPQRLSYKELISSQNSAVRNEVLIITSHYKELLSRANILSDRLSGINGRQRDYQDALDKVNLWLKEFEPKAHKIVSDPVALDPKQVEDQLVKAKAIYNEFLPNECLINNVKTSLQMLLRYLDDQLTPIEINILEEPVRELENKYKQYNIMLANKCQELDTALVQCQGIQDTLDNLIVWLNNAESQYKNLSRPASLQKERLEEQQREQRLLQADLDSHCISIEAVSTIVEELLKSSNNVRVAKSNESKLKDIQNRFEKLMDKSIHRSEYLDNISQDLNKFYIGSIKFDSWYGRMIELLESKDLHKLNISEYEGQMIQLFGNREDQRVDYESLIHIGKNLTSKKDITDAVLIRDQMKIIESQWKGLGNLLDEKHRLSKSCAERLSAYEKLHEHVLDWLNHCENRVQLLDTVAVNLEKIKQQIEELKPIQIDYRSYSNTIDKINDIGIAYDNLIKERSNSPMRRRGSSSPIKRPNIPSPLHRMSQDGRSPSPTKSYVTQSPISPGGSSGFSSRRSSQDGFHLEELSLVQQQLSEINNRYGLLGVKISDRQNELDNSQEELRKYIENLKILSKFLDKIQRKQPKDIIPKTKEESDKTVKQIKFVIEEMYEKQSLLDSTKIQIRDLVRRKTNASGANELNNELEDVVNCWKAISIKCKERIKFLENIKELYDTHEALNSWLGVKEKMLGALGPISSDPRIVASQVQQVQVLREEFKTQQPQLDHLIEVGENVLVKISIDSSDGHQIRLKLNNILQRWADQLSRLEERAQSLGDAVDTSREFDASLNRLPDALQKISDNLDDLPLDKDPEEQLRKIEHIERQLEGQRPLLADAESAAAQLCDVLSDPTSKSDIQGKLALVGKLYNNLQKKVDYRKAEIEGNLKDERQFEVSCSKTLGWLSDELGNMSEKLLVSANREILQQQLDHHEPIYRNVMSKEHEVIMLLNKGRDNLIKSQKIENRNLQRDVDRMQSQWDRLKKDMLDRHTKLQTCTSHSNKYYKTQNVFYPWLRLAEDKLESLNSTSFKRKDIEKQLKELASFRNEVWKKSGEFENNNSLAETFISACDIDKDVVKSELNTVKTRWDKLNNDLLEQTQSLEDTARHLTNFNENLRDLEHCLQRCEDKLASHDALGGAAKDPKLLDRIKNLREETVTLKRPLSAVQQQATDLIHKAGDQGVDATHLQDEVDSIYDRIEDLQAKLDDRCNELQSAATAVAQFTDILRNLNQELSNLEMELDALKPSGRDIRIVREQIEKIREFVSKINKLSVEVTKLVNSGENLVDSGFATDAVATREQIELLKRQLSKFEERVHDRKVELNNILSRLQQFCQIHGNIIDDINNVHELFTKMKPVASDVDSIRAQQDDFRALKTERIEPISRSIDNCNSIGQGLIQTAGRDVNTSNIERDLDKMNEKWNNLKERLSERDRRLDVGLLQSGKFQEALDGLAKWLTDTEEMVTNQKSPSSDYKVAKAQLQEQKFLKKMLLDRQNSISSLYKMGQDVVASGDSKERKTIEKQLRNLMGRFDNLTEGAVERMLSLERAMAVAKEFQDKLMPMIGWLERCEKKIREMELVPTDEERIQQCIDEHSHLHEDILSKKINFGELTDIASTLMALVGEEEATGLADKLQEVADRYSVLVERSEALFELLQHSKKGLRHLVLSYQELQIWLESMETQLSKYRILTVHTERLLQQFEDLSDLNEELGSRRIALNDTTEAGLELMRHISADEALQLKDKLDSLRRRYSELSIRNTELLERAQEILPLVRQFHENHSRLMDWMQTAENMLQVAESDEQDLIRLEFEVTEIRAVLDRINILGPQLCQASPGEGAASIEALVMRDNRRFDTIAEQIQRKAERLHLNKQRALELVGDTEELLEWFREADCQLRDAERPSGEPEVARIQLKEHRALNDDVSGQRSRARDILSAAKRLLRELGQHEDSVSIRDRAEELRELADTVGVLAAERLAALEQALPLAEHLRDSHLGLVAWLEEAEQQVSALPMPALRPELIALQQDRNELLLQSITEHRPLIEKLNKTGEALMHLCTEEESDRLQELVDGDNVRYTALRTELRLRQKALEAALQESSQFSDKLEGMLRALSGTAEQACTTEPVSAHPTRLRDQLEENAALADELAQRSEAFAAVCRAADDVINKAAGRSDPAVRDIRRKLDKLNSLWIDVHKTTSDRAHSLDDALTVAERFWSELSGVMLTLAELQDALASQAPPAAQPIAIERQQVALHEIRQEIDQTKPDVEQVRQSGQELMGLCGEPDKPEVRKHIEDLDQAWDNVTALYARREENLIDAMEKAMEFHGTLDDLHTFLKEAEKNFVHMGALGSDIDEIKKQIKELAQFKAEVDPRMVKVEALNRQATELTERTSSEQAQAIKEPLGIVNRRWDELLRGVVERQRLLENALLRLGQFQHALDELLVWIDRTDRTLNELRPVAGDSQIIEVELAKLKVLVNDIQAHQTSVDTLNDAGRQLIEDGKDTVEASTTTEKLSTLNRRWRDLLQCAADKQRELEDVLREAQSFTAEIQDLLSWLGDVDNAIVASKPVGGLPETASEQLERFMELYNELEQNRPKVETVLQQGKEYMKRTIDNSACGLNHNLRTLKQRWDNVTSRANDKKIKLEIALKEATEFHNALQTFVNWLTNAEKILTNLKPVSRIMETILEQIEEHKVFQKDVGIHRETMLNLDKKGTHLKYFSQKQDVILIKNLLISVQHRWERVVSKSAERTRALDHGYKEAREFHDGWSNLMNWLDETEKTLNDVVDSLGGNDPEKIKIRLQKHREIQKELSGKQNSYDTIMKSGKILKDKAPKNDEPGLRELLNELKNKWTRICNKSVDRQRKLEEALLFSGQFKDAVQALLDWLQKTEKSLSNSGPLYGDFDTVINLVEQHRNLENDLASRATQMDSVTKTGQELESKATLEDASTIRYQLSELHSLWNIVTRLSNSKSIGLKEALKDAEQLHKAVHILLEWLSNAEMKLRFTGQLPEDEQESKNQLLEHENFLKELRAKEIEKDNTLELARIILIKAHPDGIIVIKHWITIIQSRWEEVATWAHQRNQRLENHMQGLQDLDNLLEELLTWLEGLENTLINLEAESLPDDRFTLETFISEHREFMENTARRQNEVDRICKARQIKPIKDSRKLKSKLSTFIRTSPGREKTPDPSLPHIGPRFPPKGSKGTELEFRNPRVKFLWDKWRNVWMLAWERQRRLQNKLNYIEELDRVANFNWEEWRKKFLKFMNHKKSRLTDLFRKMDKNNDGLIPRDDFVQGILNTKFDTSRMEMGAVADLFDRHSEGLIDWKEFIAALRPDWEERRTYNDTDKIHDEVKRLVMLCTCRQKFRVFQVGEGKYRFGDSQKLRLVRILRSTVMVRVGGGWVALDEFLLKNDPCRAKGRTNIELREQFILADGVSQSMTAFRSKPNPTSARNQLSSAGPITKVRERSARSLPMGQMRTSRTSLNVGASDSLSDNESSFRISSRKINTSYKHTLTPGMQALYILHIHYIFYILSFVNLGMIKALIQCLIIGGSHPSSRSTSRPTSRPTSQQGSKPSSRYGSTQSLDSTDDPSIPSRIPRRMSGNTSVSSRRNSVSNKRLTISNANGSISRPRTPTDLGSPTSGTLSRLSAMNRASSIPTLTGVGTSISRSQIPVCVKTEIKSPQSTISNISTHSVQSNQSTISTDSTGTRTPSSGTSTPLPPVSKLTRKPSGASDTSMSISIQRKGKQPTPIEQRAPFRL